MMTTLELFHKNFDLGFSGGIHIHLSRRKFSYEVPVFIFFPLMLNRKGSDCLQGWIVIRQWGMVFNWDRGGLGWILGRSFSLRGW